MCTTAFPPATVAPLALAAAACRVDFATAVRAELERDRLRHWLSEAPRWEVTKVARGGTPSPTVWA
ncbi:MAG: hypothetical protein M0Z82_15340 [Actinomycetota bacterium]|nr:hypothetical protein [Actinomycetota bacterium]